MMVYKSELKGRKIYYIPGLISLFFLPIIFFRTLPRPTKFYTILTYVSPSDAKDKTQYTQSFTGQYLMKTIRKKKIIPFYLDADHELNNKKFKLIRFEALRLKFECDTNHVIAVHLNDSISYHEFIKLLNMMQKDHHKRYVDWKNIFYIFGEAPPDPENEIQPIYL